MIEKQPDLEINDDTWHLDLYNRSYKFDKKTFKNRPLLQFNESSMSSKFCYKTRLGGKKYQFPETSKFENMRGEEFHTGVPLCEAHLKLSQMMPKRSSKGGDNWEMKGRFKSVTIGVANAVLLMVAYFLQFLTIADYGLYALIAFVVFAFNYFMYGNIAFISLLKMLVLLPQMGFFSFIITILPWDAVPFIYGIITRRMVINGVLKHNNVAISSSQKGNHKVYRELYPMPLVDWKKEGVPNAPTLIELVEEKKTKPKKRSKFTPMEPEMEFASQPKLIESEPMMDGVAVAAASLRRKQRY